MPDERGTVGIDMVDRFGRDVLLKGTDPRAKFRMRVDDEFRSEPHVAPSVFLVPEDQATW
ncbi:MAG: hypothetical protein AAFZ01_02325 [Pseudomonadota bacterium]